ncbi:MAG: rRNA maturation RNase YbeY [Planctomycetaceae bacterium]
MPPSPYQVDVSNQQVLLEIDEAALKKIIRGILADERVQSAELSLAIVDNDMIWELNRRYLCHDYPTDVLSFLLDVEMSEEQAESQAKGTLPVPRGVGKKIDGELIVSAEMALQTAGKYGWTPQAELILYVIHGVLHLCGYDDLNEKEQALMRSREQDILRRWDITSAEDAVHPVRSRK